MWQIILQILSIIGIFVLVLLVLLFLVIGFVLFVPLRYKVRAIIDTDKGQYSGEGKITWLLHALSVYVSYPEPGTITIRVLGYPFRVIELKKSDLNVESSRDIQNEKKDESLLDNTGETSLDNRDESSDDLPEQQDKSAKHQEVEDDFVKEEPKKKWYEKILYTTKNLYDKIKKIWNNIKYYNELLDAKENRLFFARSKKRLAKLLKAIAPKRLKGQLIVGTGAPDTTGYLLAFYGMLVPYLDKDFYLEPDFEEAICQGQVEMTGRIFVITLLVFVLKFVTDKQLSVLLKKLKREEH